MAEPDCDVAIIGGGPAGSALGAYLAQAGLECVVFERDLFPRPHVGESLVPSSTRVFNDLGLIPKLEQAGFPRKYGAAWTAPSTQVYSHDFSGLDQGVRPGPAPNDYAGVAFAERAQAGVDMAYTYHVDRGAFDLLLLQHAQELGARVYEGIHVKHVDFGDPDHVRVEFDVGRARCSTRARMVVDASGRRTMLGSQLGWKVKDPVFDQYALHTWFEGFDRAAACQDRSKAEYIYIHFLPLSNSWVWQIPISDTVTSVGVVTQKQQFVNRRGDHEQFFWECLDTRPELADGLRRAEQIRPLKKEGDYSYAMKRICADRLLLIGDAARFVDPIFSTGVSIALNSARFASRDIVRAAEAGDFSAPRFDTYQATISRGMRNWHEFITVYYRLNVLFTAFVLDERYRLDVLKLLQGDVYDDEEPAVLARMRDIVTEVERNAQHVWHGLLNDLTSNAFVPAF